MREFLSEDLQNNLQFQDNLQNLHKVYICLIP